MSRMSKGNYLQKQRKANVDLFRKWVEEDVSLHSSEGWSWKNYSAQAESIIVQKGMNVIGCTRRKASEYLDEVFGRFEE